MQSRGQPVGYGVGCLSSMLGAVYCRRKSEMSVSTLRSENDTFLSIYLLDQSKDQRELRQAVAFPCLHDDW